MVDKLQHIVHEARCTNRKIHLANLPGVCDFWQKQVNGDKHKRMAEVFDQDASEQYLEYFNLLNRLIDTIDGLDSPGRRASENDSQIILDLEAENDRLRNRILELEMALNP